METRETAVPLVVRLLDSAEAQARASAVQIAGGRVDLTDRLTSHAAYVSAVTSAARDLQEQGYLLEVDADAIIDEAQDSDIGN